MLAISGSRVVVVQLWSCGYNVGIETREPGRKTGSCERENEIEIKICTVKNRSPSQVTINLYREPHRLVNCRCRANSRTHNRIIAGHRSHTTTSRGPTLLCRTFVHISHPLPYSLERRGRTPLVDEHNRRNKFVTMSRKRTILISAGLWRWWLTGRR